MHTKGPPVQPRPHQSMETHSKKQARQSSVLDGRIGGKGKLQKANKMTRSPFSLLNPLPGFPEVCPFLPSSRRNGFPPHTNRSFVVCQSLIPQMIARSLKLWCVCGSLGENRPVDKNTFVMPNARVFSENA